MLPLLCQPTSYSCWDLAPSLLCSRAELEVHPAALEELLVALDKELWIVNVSGDVLGEGASGVTSVPQRASLGLDTRAAFLWSQRQRLLNNRKY